MVKFIQSSNNYREIEKVPSRGEICFFGRSNAGKSSLINALFECNAFVSKTPGKTVSLNFYSFQKYTIVDSPGYGFAKGNMNEQWGELGAEYLEYRLPLKMCFVLIDSRRGLMESDWEMIDFIEFHKTPYTLIYTKLDKLNHKEFIDIQNNDRNNLRSLKLKYIKYANDEQRLLSTSAKDDLGIGKLFEYVKTCLAQKS